MKRHHKATVGLFMVLIVVCTFLTTPVFVQAQEAQADQEAVATVDFSNKKVCRVVLPY